MKTNKLLPLLLTLSVLAPFTARADATRSYNRNSTIEASHPDWMRWVPDSKRLSELSLPGTHDTMSRYGGDLVETQSLPLRSQLDAGIRVLDIRCRHIEDVFAIHHGVVFQNAYFGADVLGVCYDFLQDHPTETIIMIMGGAGVPEAANCTRTYEETFVWYRDSTTYGSCLFRTNSTGFSTMQTLGAVRGKVVLLQDFSGDRHGYDYDDYSNLMDMQNEYDLNTIFKRDNKWDIVQDFFRYTDGGAVTFTEWDGTVHDRAAEDGRFYLNWTSATSGNGGVYPNAVAIYVNPRALEYLFGCSQTRTTGIVMMDFPGAALIDAVIAHNMKFAINAAQIGSDFDYLFGNISHSATHDGDDECRDHVEQLSAFLNFVLPNQRWSVLATSTPDADDWGYALSPAGLYDTTDEVHGFRHTAMAGPVFSADVTSTELSAYLTTSQLQTLSGTAQARASSLKAMLQSHFPFTRWNAVVKKEPGGLGNWAYLLFARASYATGFIGDDGEQYSYVAWTTTGENRPPIGVDLGPLTTGEGMPLTLDASAAFDPDGDTLWIRWDTDGDNVLDTMRTTSPFMFVSFPTERSITNHYEIYDGARARIYPARIAVTNVPPRISLGADETVIQGETLARKGSFTDAGADSWTVQVNYGDGTVANIPFNANHIFDLSHKYLVAGDYEVVVTVNDGTASSQASFAVSVIPAAGTPQFLSLVGPVGPQPESSSITVTGRFYNTSWVEGTALKVGWGDGPPPEFLTDGVAKEGGGYWSFVLTHIYADDDFGIYDGVVDVTVPGTGRRRLPLNMQNVEPLLSPDPTSIGGFEGWEITRALTVMDPGADIWQILTDFGDGASAITNTGNRSYVLQHRYDQPGAYNARVTIMDDEGAYSTMTIPVTVTNAVPFWSNFTIHTNMLAEGQVVNVTGIFTSSSLDYDTFVATIDWGDGSPFDEPEIEPLNSQFKIVHASHRYADNPAPGAYVLTAALRDDDGSTNFWTTSLWVTNVAPWFKLGRNHVAHPDNSLNYYGFITDPGDDQWTLRVDYGDGTGWTPVTLINSTYVLNHQYQVPGLYNVTAELTDGDGGMATDNTRVLAGLPSLNIVRFAPGKVQVSWPAHAAAFRLQSTSDGRFNDWDNVDDPVTSSGGTNDVTIPIANKPVFYRLIVEW